MSQLPEKCCFAASEAAHPLNIKHVLNIARDLKYCTVFLNSVGLETCSRGATQRTRPTLISSGYTVISSLT